MDSIAAISQDFIDCKRCALCNTRRQVVIGRGAVPARVLFIGEAPGKSENLLGFAFQGPSGRLLNATIVAAEDLTGRPFPSYYIDNVIACVPWVDDKCNKVREPDVIEINHCRERLKRIINVVNPHVLVAVGQTARNHTHKLHPITMHVLHPAFLLRSGGQSSSGYPAYVRSFADIIERFGE